MKAEKLLEILKRNRKGGSTTLAAEAIKSNPDAVLICTSSRDAQTLRGKFDVPIVTLDTPYQGRHPRPVIIDNYAIENVLSEALMRIKELEKQLANSIPV